MDLKAIERMVQKAAEKSPARPVVALEAGDLSGAMRRAAKSVSRKAGAASNGSAQAEWI